MEPFQNSRRGHGTLKQVLYRGPTNIRHHCTKFRGHGDLGHGKCVPLYLYKTIEVVNFTFWRVTCDFCSLLQVPTWGKYLQSVFIVVVVVLGDVSHQIIVLWVSEVCDITWVPNSKICCYLNSTAEHSQFIIIIIAIIIDIQETEVLLFSIRNLSCGFLFIS